MVERPTVNDLARMAGVSVATVDRVINNRLPVREDTARRVLEAAERLGFHATKLIRSRLRQQLPEFRVGLLLQKPEDPFYRGLAAQLERAITGNPEFRGAATIRYWTRYDPDEIAAELRALSGNADAVALVCPDYPAIVAAVEEIRSHDIPVFTLLSDCAPASRTCFLGIDGRQCGRTAGWIIRQTARRPGKVAVIIGNHQWRGQESREIGIRAYFRQHAPEFAVLDAIVNAESDLRTEEAVGDLLTRHHDLVGIYVAGGGRAGAIARLRVVPPDRRPALICTAQTGETRAGLEEGIVTMTICEPLDRLCEKLVVLVHLACGDSAARVPGHVFLPLELHTPENV